MTAGKKDQTPGVFAVWPDLGGESANMIIYATRVMGAFMVCSCLILMLQEAEVDMIPLIVLNDKSLLGPILALWR
jgi:hypothetical protein